MREKNLKYLFLLVNCSFFLILSACESEQSSTASTESAATLQLTQAPAAAAQSGDDLPESHNMRLLGLHELQGRSSYMPFIHAYGDRRILFVGHHRGEALNEMTGEVETNGMSILDVTDPSQPELLKHLPPHGEAQFTQHVQVCDGADLPSGNADRVYAIATNGNLGYEVLDVTDPANPEYIQNVGETGYSSRLESTRGDRETHKIQWECDSGIAWLNGTPQDWRVTRLLQLFDVSDPNNPTHIRDFGLPEYAPDADAPFPHPRVAGLHQPTVVGNRVFLGYNSGGDGVLQILDRDRLLNGIPGATDPFAPTPENLTYPEIARVDFPSYYGVHTAKPLYDFTIADYADNRDNSRMDILMVVSESNVYRCQENRDLMWMLDITEDDKPIAIGSWQASEEPGDFCNRGGRFGPHSFHDAWHPGFDHSISVLSYFNGGIRAVDIRNPFAPAEIGYYIPEVNDNTRPSCIEIDDTEECDVEIQTNNVNIDDRGYIYAVDRAGTGLHIVGLTGDAAAIVN